MTSSYSQRLNAFSPTKIWTLTPNDLSWVTDEDQKKTGSIALKDIQKVRLRYEPSRAERRRVGLHIYAPYDHHITNINYMEPMNFDHTPETFRGFVTEFHKLFPDDTDTVFHQGSTMGAYIGNAVITLLIFVFLMFLAPILTITGIPGATSIARITVLVIFVPTLIRILSRNRPRLYRPNELPTGLLD